MHVIAFFVIDYAVSIAWCMQGDIRRLQGVIEPLAERRLIGQLVPVVMTPAQGDRLKANCRLKTVSGKKQSRSFVAEKIAKRIKLEVFALNGCRAL